MKIRNGFVSNSSSSSFTCNVCHDTVSGYDMGLSEAEMFSCEGGHRVCNSHSKRNPEDYINSEEWRQEALPDLKKLYPDTNFDEMDEEAVDDYLSDWRHDAISDMPASFCPVCRLEVIRPEEEVLWLRHELNITKKVVHERIRTQFDNLKDMMETVG